jgi:hypothetical protein
MVRHGSIVFVILCGIASGVYAAPTWVLGVKGGINVADLSGDGVDAAKSRTAFDGGVFFGAELTPHFGARIEGLFVGKGAEGTITTPGDNHPHESTWTLNALEFPVVAVGRIPIGAAVKLGAFVGPTFAFKLKSEIQTTHGLEDVDSVTEDFEVGGTLGGEVQYVWSPIAIVGDARYSAGFTSVVADIAGQSIDVKTRGLGVRLGLQYAFGQR